ncbi:hypothetical protein QAD02_018385 [Eretmocerus hayati]|uniref:Uncharacterized protein n=1 Tax=Eretmocerus hayati TaxID=131215 RepID=A0ACC2PHM9_9HYME|nr:hypothetical protein QAD02_018385 [Eretmocerus hayati]
MSHNNLPGVTFRCQKALDTLFNNPTYENLCKFAPLLAEYLDKWSIEHLDRLEPHQMKMNERTFSLAIWDLTRGLNGYVSESPVPYAKGQDYKIARDTFHMIFNLYVRRIKNELQNRNVYFPFLYQNVLRKFRNSDIGSSIVSNVPTVQSGSHHLFVNIPESQVILDPERLLDFAPLQGAKSRSHHITKRKLILEPFISIPEDWDFGLLCVLLKNEQTFVGYRGTEPPPTSKDYKLHHFCKSLYYRNIVNWDDKHVSFVNSFCRQQVQDFVMSHNSLPGVTFRCQKALETLFNNPISENLCKFAPLLAEYLDKWSTEHLDRLEPHQMKMNERTFSLAIWDLTKGLNGYVSESPVPYAKGQDYKIAKDTFHMVHKTTRRADISFIYRGIASMVVELKYTSTKEDIKIPHSSNSFQGFVDIFDKYSSELRKCEVGLAINAVLVQARTEAFCQIILATIPNTEDLKPNAIYISGVPRKGQEVAFKIR